MQAYKVFQQGYSVLSLFPPNPNSSFACENFEAKLEAAKKSVKALKDEVRGLEIQSSWLARLIASLGDENILDRLKTITTTSRNILPSFIPP